MATEEGKVREDYVSNFNVNQYIEFRLNNIQSDTWEENHVFWFSCLYDFFNTENFTGDRLLDLASGPTVHNMGSAASCFSNIVLSDLLESNLEELRKWLKKDPGCKDWTKFIRLVAKAEKFDNIEEGCKEIEERIRSSVKDVIYCDLLNDKVLPEEYSQILFDAIVSALTLENVAVDYESYCKCLARMNKLLKKGGKLIMIGLTMGTGYKCNNQPFHFLQIKQEDIHKALEENGFGDINWKTREQPSDQVPYICEKIYFVTSSKL